MADEASDLRGAPAGTVHCLLEDVVSYRAGDLPPERSCDFEDHLRICAACRRLVRDAATVLTGVGMTVRAAGSRAGDVDQLLQGLRRKLAERSATRPRQPSRRFWLPVAGVALVVLLVALLQLLMVIVPRFWRRGDHPRGVGSANTPDSPLGFGPLTQPVRPSTLPGDLALPRPPDGR